MRPTVNERGMTLLEVLVAAVVLGIIAVGLFTAFGVGTRLTAGAREQVKAVNLAREKMQELQAVPYDDLNTGVTGKEEFVPSVSGFTYRVSVTDSGANLKSVTVAVYYTETGMAKQVSLTMERAKL